MASSDVGIGALTEEQQLALQQFTSVTDQNIDAAVPLLERCQWNVQIAIARFFDGEPPEPVAGSIPDTPSPQDIRRQETLLNGFSRPSPSLRRDIDPAPRVVPQPEGQVTQQAPFLLSILFMPFNLAYTILSRTFGAVGYLFPFLPRLLARFSANRTSPTRRSNTSGRRPLNPRDTAARFIREFEEEYGANELPFFENGYAQAFDLAKKELKFLLVVLVSPEHDDTTSFIRDTLLSSEVVNFIKSRRDNLVLWAGNVQDSEAYQVSTALNCTKFPFAALIVHTPSVSSTSMSIVARIAGPTPPSAFVSKLQSAMAQNSEALSRMRSQRAEQQATRNLREQQNSAYERSLAQDRERARQSEDTTAFDVGKPANYEHEYKFRLVSPMPREVYELENGGTVKERIGRSGNLIVERTVEEDEDEGVAEE